MENLRRFSKTDWYGYEGAEHLPSGSAPLIGTRTIWEDGKERTVTVLVTGNEGAGAEEFPVAVSVHVFNSVGGDAEEEWWYTSRATEEGGEDLGTFLLRASPMGYVDGSADLARDLALLGFRRTL